MLIHCSFQLKKNQQKEGNEQIFNNNSTNSSSRENQPTSTRYQVQKQLTEKKAKQSLRLTRTKRKDSLISENLEVRESERDDQGMKAGNPKKKKKLV